MTDKDEKKTVWFKTIEDIGSEHIIRIGCVPHPDDQTKCYGKMLECRESDGNITITTSRITAIEPYYNQKRISKSDAMDIVVGLLSRIPLDFFVEGSE